MTIYKTHKEKSYFDFIKEGKKTIEIRLKKEKHTLIKPGDILHVYRNDEEEDLKVKVLDVRNYQNFEEMLEKEEIQKIIPDTKTSNDILKTVRKFYTPESEKKYGVLAIEIALI